MWLQYNARTYLQPQLNKAVGRTEVSGSEHRHLKDYLLCYASQGSFSNTMKDNTGEGPGNYAEDLIFPTLSFPYAHTQSSCAVLLLSLLLRKTPKSSHAICRCFVMASSLVVTASSEACLGLC